ncbi:MAG TPA: helix-turn-helix domain-containing protein [Patescibacteria group bacterium]|nr:helix-turn-helix domain-containing protein [Patescibacteria group bacterium]
MKTIGEIIKSARVRKSISLKSLEETTKIKGSFIDAIEKQKWESLPPFPTVLGFIKSLSSPLNLDEKAMIAFLKRDYPPKKLGINPKPDVGGKFLWNPKYTFIAGIVIAALSILGYFGFQYYRFVSPPRLNIESPKENQIVTGGDLIVFGSTDSDAKITVNNQPVLVDEAGKFSVSVPVVPETEEVVVVATNRSGKSATVKRTINVQ